MIETACLRLRSCRDSDKPVFAAILNTPAMMAELGGVRRPDAIETRSRDDGLYDRAAVLTAGQSLLEVGDRGAFRGYLRLAAAVQRLERGISGLQRLGPRDRQLVEPGQRGGR